MKINFKQQGDYIVINITGKFAINTFKLFEEKWSEILTIKPKVVGINFKNVEYIDSYIIGMLVKYYNESMNKKIDLVLIDLNEEIQRIFDTAKLGNFFPILSKGQFYEKYFM